MIARLGAIVRGRCPDVSVRRAHRARYLALNSGIYSRLEGGGWVRPMSGPTLAALLRPELEVAA